MSLLTNTETAKVIIPIEVARRLAEEFGYTEIAFNTTSRVLSFRKDQSRINVYYSTGTIATCLDHPTQGKTQLFRRNMNVDDLRNIFQNPRHHTGAGYYTTNQGSMHQQRGPTRWSKTSVQPKRQHRIEKKSRGDCDDAQRWRYVIAATNLCNLQQAQQVAAICETFNDLRYAAGKTSIQEWREFDEEFRNEINPRFDKCECGRCGQDRAGSTCSLFSILWKVLEKTVPSNQKSVPTIIPVLLRTKEPRATDSGHTDTMEVDGESEKSHIPDLIPVEGFVNCSCREGGIFLDAYSSKLDTLRRQLMSLPKPLRREVLYFFFKKLCHGHDLMMMTHHPEIDGKEVHCDKFGHMYLSDVVLSAHFDYGEMVYNQNEPCHPCNCHGITS